MEARIILRYNLRYKRVICVQLTLCGFDNSKQHEVSKEDKALGTSADTNSNICLDSSSIFLNPALFILSNKLRNTGENYH